MRTVNFAEVESYLIEEAAY